MSITKAKCAAHTQKIFRMQMQTDNKKNSKFTIAILAILMSPSIMIKNAQTERQFRMQVTTINDALFILVCIVCRVQCAVCICINQPNEVRGIGINKQKNYEASSIENENMQFKRTEKKMKWKNETEFKTWFRWKDIKMLWYFTNNIVRCPLAIVWFLPVMNASRWTTNLA